MKQKIITFSAFLFLLSVNTVFSQSGWFQQTSNTTVQLNAIMFANVNTGMVVGNGGIIRRTSNGGANWEPVTAPAPGTQSFFDIWIEISPPNNVHMVDDGGRIFLSSNYGNTWTLQNSGTTSPLNAVMFENSSAGHVVGNNVLLGTNNGGNNWTPQPPPLSASFFDIFFPVSSTGFVAGDRIALKSSNAGANWNVILTPTSRLNTVVFQDANTGLVAGENGNVMRTNNAGVNWTPVNAPIPIEILSMSLVSANPITVTGVGTSGGIIRTQNIGTNWTIQYPPVTQSFFDVFFIDLNTGWICGGNGTILKTITGGISGIEPIGNEIPERFQLYQNYPNPFNPSTRITFDVPSSPLSERGDRGGFVKLTIFSALGKEVATLINQSLKPGRYETEWNAANIPSGVYFYALYAGDFTAAKKMILLK